MLNVNFFPAMFNSVEKMTVGGFAVRTYCLKVVLLPVDFWSKSSTTFDDKVVLLLVNF